MTVRKLNPYLNDIHNQQRQGQPPNIKRQLLPHMPPQILAKHLHILSSFPSLSFFFRLIRLLLFIAVIEDTQLALLIHIRTTHGHGDGVRGDVHHDDVEEPAGGSECGERDDGESGRADAEGLEEAGEDSLAGGQGCEVTLNMGDRMMSAGKNADLGSLAIRYRG